VEDMGDQGVFVQSFVHPHLTTVVEIADNGSYSVDGASETIRALRSKP
jgi:hypothetical protein